MVPKQIGSQISRAAGFLIECSKLVVAEPKLLLPPLLSVIFGFVMGMLVVIPFIFLGFLDKYGFYAFGGTALFLLLINHVFSYLFMGASSYAVYQHIRLGQSSMAEAFNRALYGLLTLLMLAATASIIRLIWITVNIMKRRGKSRDLLVNLLSSFAGDVLREGWDIVVRLLVPVSMITGLGYRDTIRKSFDIVRHNVAIISIGEVTIRGMTGITGLIGYLISILIAIVLFFMMANTNFKMALEVAVLALFVCVTLASTLKLFIRASYYTMLYAWAEECQTGSILVGSVVVTSTPLQNVFKT